MNRLSTGFALVITMVIVAPVAVVVTSVGRSSGGLWQHLASTVLPGYIRNTLLLALGVAALTSLVGISTAWLVTLCRFPGRGLMRWALLLPLAIPAYLGAYAYTDLLQFAGPVQGGLRELFGWSRGDYWFPQVRSLSGATVLLSLALYPYVYMAARAAFLEQSMASLEAARTLGLGPWRCFARVALPLARPSITAGVALVLMETLAEFGAVQYCAVDTFATGIVRTFTLPNEYALTAAAQLSAVLLVFVAVLVVAEARSRRSARFHGTTRSHRTLSAWRLRGFKAWMATGVCALPVVLGFVIPLVLFASMSIRSPDARMRETFLEMGRNTFFLASVASVMAVVLGLALAAMLRFRDRPLMRALVTVSGMGYAVPGAVLAIGVLIVLSWADVGLGNAVSWMTGTPRGLIFSGTAVAVLYGYQSRFLAVSLNFIRAGLTRIEPTLDDAARTLGASPSVTLWRVQMPLLRGTLLAAMILVFVDVVKELPATLLLRPFGLETLAVRVYQLASDERLSEASSGALAIILVGLLPVVVLSWLIDRSQKETKSVESELEILGRSA